MLQLKNSTEITTQLKRALKTADSLVFHFKNNQSFIRCIKEDEFRNIVNEVVIYCETSISNYSGFGKSLGEVRSAVHVETSIRYNKIVQSVLSKIKKGDRLGLYWVANNDNQYLREAGLHRDELRLVIFRNGKQVDEFLLNVSVVPNNTAKMIKHSSTPVSVLGD